MARATNVEVLFKDNQIILKIGLKKMVLYSSTIKEIKGSELIDVFDYKKGKKYNLKELAIPNNITEDEEKYLSEYYKLIETIIDKL